MSLALHELYDVSVAFASETSARAAWQTIFRTEAASAGIDLPTLNGLATLGSKPLPVADLDLRLCGPDFEIGAAYVGLKLGIVDQLSIRRMQSDPRTGQSLYPDPWAEVGRMRLASLLVADFLGLGGHAVVLHKAAATVKTAQQFRYELGNVHDPAVRPYLAWLDTLVGESEGGLEARSYGMPHYFGAPNVRATTRHRDPFAIERVMQAVKHTCARVAAGNENPFQLTEVAVPLWYAPGRRPPSPPAPDDPSLAWHASQEPEVAMIALVSSALDDRHPSLLWSAARAEPSAMPFEPYARALADMLAHRVHTQGLQLVDFARFGSDNVAPVRVLVFERRDLALYVSAGFGRLPSASGTDDAATLHAEVCLCAPPDEALRERLESWVLRTGHIALTTPVPGGLKDWDGMPPSDELGWGFVLAPLPDVQLSSDRPLALRMIVPITRDEYASYRSSADRSQWYQAHVAGWEAVATRWASLLGG